MKKAEKLPRLKELYIKGHTLTKASELAGISRNTAKKWQLADEEATGETWDRLRDKQVGRNPTAPLESAREYLQCLLDNQRKLREDAGFADRLWKACSVVEKLEARLSDPERILGALRPFASWLTPRLDDAELSRYRELFAAFMADLRSGKVEVL